MALDVSATISTSQPRARSRSRCGRIAAISAAASRSSRCDEYQPETRQGRGEPARRATHRASRGNLWPSSMPANPPRGPPPDRFPAASRRRVPQIVVRPGDGIGADADCHARARLIGRAGPRGPPPGRTPPAPPTSHQCPPAWVLARGSVSMTITVVRGGGLGAADGVLQRGEVVGLSPRWRRGWRHARGRSTPAARVARRREVVERRRRRSPAAAG